MKCLELNYFGGKDYYPFGMLLVGRNWTSGNDYRYGFNNQEQDDEVYGNGNLNSTEFREYDTRLGRWLSLDPLFNNFPWQSPYVAFDNNPIFFKDPKGAAAEDGIGDKKEERKRRQHQRWSERRSQKMLDKRNKLIKEYPELGTDKFDTYSEASAKETKLNDLVAEKYGNRRWYKTTSNNPNGYMSTTTYQWDIDQTVTNDNSVTLQPGAQSNGQGTVTFIYQLPPDVTEVKLTWDNYGVPDRYTVTDLSGNQLEQTNYDKFQGSSSRITIPPNPNGTTLMVTVNTRQKFVRRQQATNYQFTLNGYKEVRTKNLIIEQKGTIHD